MDNLKIRVLREKLIDDLNEVEIPIEVKRRVLKEVMSAVNNAADKEIEKEREALVQSMKKEGAEHAFSGDPGFQQQCQCQPQDHRQRYRHQ